MKDFVMRLGVYLLLSVLLVSCGTDGNDNEQRAGSGTNNNNEEYKEPAYERLEEALARYRQIRSEGGWEKIPDEPGTLIQKGDSSHKILLLRERLAATGDLSGQTDSDSTYDEELHDAVVRFQNRHGIMEDGKIGPSTLEELNKPVEERIEQIKYSLEMWKSLPDSLGEKYILVNIPEFRLRAFEDAEEAMRMKVIVGEEYAGKQTPLLNDTIEYIVFNPYWNIPESIAKKEIVPEAKKDLAYMDKNNYEIIDKYGEDAEVLETNRENLKKVDSGEYKLRQQPGIFNALGLIKFMFPNDSSIYLHGTPEDHLFSRLKRDFSHGCIRVHDPKKLAEFLLKTNSPAWTEEQIQDSIDSREHLEVPLDNKVPVYISYFIAYVDKDGTVNFRRDIYGKHEEDYSASDSLTANTRN